MNSEKKKHRPKPDIANQLQFTAKNLGVILEGSITPKPLTLFCGPNNSGKTWVMYSLYYYYSTLNTFTGTPEWMGDNRLHVLKLLTEKMGKHTHMNKLTTEKKVKALNDFMEELLPLDIFNVSAEELHGASFKLENIDFLLRSIDKWKQSYTFLMPAERSGLHIFFRELSTRRTALLRHAQKKNIDLNELLRDVMQTPHAFPVADYIDWLNGQTNSMKQRSKHFHEFAEQLKKSLAGGAYRVEKSSGRITFKPYQKKRDGKAVPTLDLHATSSTVKSLFGLWFYLEYQAKPGDILMIDEPELSIHPDNQRKIARLLARLVNAGLRIVISTHSDYIVRELNTLIMLGQKGGEKLRKKHKYQENEVLSTDQVAAYLFDDRTIKPFEITPDDGIYATTFDEVIKNLNEVNDDIYYTLQELQNG